MSDERHDQQPAHAYESPSLEVIGTVEAGHARLAKESDVLAVNPLVDPRFVSALAARGGRLGFGDRTETTDAILGALLPRRLIERRTKATYDEVFWGAPSREFAEGWSGGGVDTEIVDPGALRREWLKPRPMAASAALLQSAWLATTGRP
ncbi:MAG: hypothetical protein ACR2N5_06185 [Solirubrobacterales bacterium]